MTDEEGPWSRARAAVYYALRKGLLVKEPCDMCGEEDVVAHHDNYNKPFEVRWLCRRCHNKWHQHYLPVPRRVSMATKRMGRLLKPREVAVLLSVTPRTVVRWIREGKLGGHKLGRVWRIPSDDPQLHLMLDHQMYERFKRPA